MIKALMILVYLYQGQPKMEHKYFNDMAECRVMAGRRANELAMDPKFHTGIYAACIEVSLTEVLK